MSDAAWARCPAHGPYCSVGTEECCCADLHRLPDEERRFLAAVTSCAEMVEISLAEILLEVPAPMRQDVREAVLRRLVGAGAQGA